MIFINRLQKRMALIFFNNSISMVVTDIIKENRTQSHILINSMFFRAAFFRITDFFILYSNKIVFYFNKFSKKTKKERKWKIINWQRRLSKYSKRWKISIFNWIRMRNVIFYLFSYSILWICNVPLVTIKSFGGFFFLQL